MPNKATPELLVEIYDRAGVPKLQHRGLGFADVVGHLFETDKGEATGDEAAGEGAEEYQQQSKLTAISPTLELITMTGITREGSSREIAVQRPLRGFYLRGRELVQDSYIVGSGWTGDLGWTVTEGSAANWETVRPTELPVRQRVKPSKAIPNAVTQITSSGEASANQNMWFDLHYMGTIAGHSATSKPAIRLMWGKETLSIVRRLGAEATVERMVNGQWQVWRRLSNSRLTAFRGRERIRIRRIAGRLVVGINNQEWDIFDPERDITWQKGRLRVNLWGVMTTVGVGLISYTDDDSNPLTGSFSRVQPWPVLVNTNPAGQMTGGTRGWNNQGTQTAVAFTMPTLADFALSYTCTLTASPDGIDTPFVSEVVAGYDAEWEPEVASGLMVEGALLHAHESLAEPGVMSSAEWTLDFDRRLLDAIDPDWQDYIKPFNPVKIAVRWKYDDNSEGDLVGRFTGYIWDDPRSNPAFGEYGMTVTCKDPTMRLQAPASMIDHWYAPLDLLLFKMQPASVYGGHCVQYLLRQSLGDAWADDFNGNGDVLRWFYHDQDGNSTHYPLLSATTSGYFGGLPSQPPPTSSGHMALPAPFGSDVIGWIEEIQGYDGAVFFFGIVDGAGVDVNGITWPVPIYGNYQVIVADMPTHEVRDNALAAGYLFGGANVTGVPESAYNRVLVQVEGFDNPMIPSLIAAEARLPLGEDDDPNAASHTWERTLIKRLPANTQPAAVAALAMLLMQQFADKDLQAVDLHFPQGLEDVWWGHKMHVTMDGADCINQSDGTLNIHDKTFRVIQVENDYDFQGAAVFTSDVSCFALSALGL